MACFNYNGDLHNHKPSHSNIGVFSKCLGIRHGTVNEFSTIIRQWNNGGPEQTDHHLSTSLPVPAWCNLSRKNPQSRCIIYQGMAATDSMLILCTTELKLLHPSCTKAGDKEWKISTVFETCIPMHSSTVGYRCNHTVGIREDYHYVQTIDISIYRLSISGNGWDVEIVS